MLVTSITLPLQAASNGRNYMHYMANYMLSKMLMLSHDDGDSGDSRAGPRPAGHDDTDAAAAGAPDGLRELPGCQGLGVTAVSACFCPYHCHICMYTVCMCLYLHVCVCILNDLENKSLSMKCHTACMLHVCCMYVS